MVITTCSSCNTLVSLDEGLKNRSGDVRSACCEEHVLCKTELLLPEEEKFGYDDDDYWSMSTSVQQQNIYIPSNEMDAVDICLKSNPSIMETADELLANSPRYFSAESPERVLYVAQGEMAHATPSQCDVLVSDKATTCHILAVRSTMPGMAPLASLTHIDGTSYENCIREMIAEHKSHHGQWMICGCCEQDEKKEECLIYERIEMEVHIMGGFEDASGASREISNVLVHLLARIASEERNLLRMTLKTCAISSMNDNGYSCPIGRGMGIDLHTGKTFLAKVDASAAGPLQDLRSCRLWMNHGPKQLSVIHTAHSNNLIVTPFFFQRFQEVDMLLNLDDDVLLQCTSTSPDVEEDDFCDNVRSSLRYLCDNQSHIVFGDCKPLLHSRIGSSNLWHQCLTGRF